MLQVSGSSRTQWLQMWMISWPCTREERLTLVPSLASRGTRPRLGFAKRTALAHVPESLASVAQLSSACSTAQLTVDGPVWRSVTPPPVVCPVLPPAGSWSPSARLPAPAPNRAPRDMLAPSPAPKQLEKPYPSPELGGQSGPGDRRRVRSQARLWGSALLGYTCWNLILRNPRISLWVLSCVHVCPTHTRTHKLSPV